MKLSVYDLSGREVARLVEGVVGGQGRPPYQEGSYAVTWDASSVPAGVYLVRLQAGGEVKVAKAVLVR